MFYNLFNWQVSTFKWIDTLFVCFLSVFIAFLKRKKKSTNPAFDCTIPSTFFFEKYVVLFIPYFYMKVAE